jgi:hypothetical protein
MATKKKGRRKKIARRGALWVPDGRFAPGTVTVTVSLAYIQRMIDNVMKGLKDPKVLLRLRYALDRVLSEKLSKKTKSKKTPGRDPGLN